jgi:hypothetical protein
MASYMHVPMIVTSDIPWQLLLILIKLESYIIISLDLLGYAVTIIKIRIGRYLPRYLSNRLMTVIIRLLVTAQAETHRINV